MKQAHRFSGPGGAYEGLTTLGPSGPTWTGAIRTVPSALEEPLRWQKPARIFVNSMSDLFHPDVPDAFIDQVFAVMAMTPRHVYQILTKRPERMRQYFASGQYRDVHVIDAAAALGFRIPPEVLLPRVNILAWPLPNVHLGVSAEHQAAADDRIPLLRATPAAVRFVSFEPLLGPIRLAYVGTLDWIILGGESGPGARPCQVEWLRSLVAQFTNAHVPVFVKQLGAKPRDHAARPLFLHDRKGGDISEWPEDLRLRQHPGAGLPSTSP